MIKGLNFLNDDFNEMRLPSGKAASEGLKMVDSPDANIPRSQKVSGHRSSQAINLEQKGLLGEGAPGLGTPGETISLQTPVGVPEPDELEAAGKGMSSIAKALATPGVQRALAHAGIAFSKGNPNEVGTILGQGALGLVESQQIAKLADALASGGQISDVDTTGLSTQGFQQASQIAATRRGSEQQDRGLNIEQQRADLQERLTDLRERGLELDEDKFDFDKITTQDQLDIATARLDLQDRSIKIDEQIAPHRIALLEAEKAQLERGGTIDDPKFQESIRLRRQQLLETLTDRLEQEREILDTIKSPFNAETESTRSWPFKFIPGKEKNTEEYQKLIDEQQGVVEKITGYIDEVQGLAIEGVGGSVEDTDGGEVDDLPESAQALGTEANPIKITSQADIDNAAPGQFLLDLDGKLRRKR